MDPERYQRFESIDNAGGRENVSALLTFLVLILVAGGTAAVFALAWGWGVAEEAAPTAVVQTDSNAAAPTDGISTAQAEPTTAPPAVSATEQATPSPSIVQPSPMAAAESTPAQPEYFVVGNTDGDGVALRRTPDLNDRLVAWPDGARMQVVGPAVSAGGLLWRHVRDPRGNEGYIPDKWLVPAQ